MDRPKKPSGSTPAGTGHSPHGSATAALFSNQFDFRQALVILRSHFLVALALAIVACTYLGWQQMRRPKIYAATANIAIERPENVADLKRFGVEQGEEQEPYLLTKISEMRNPEVSDYAAHTLTPEERDLILKPYETDGAKYLRDDHTLAGFIRGVVGVDREPGTLLVSIGVTHLDPRAAALIANRYAEQCIKYLFDKSTASTNTALSFLKDQAEDLRKKLEASERSLQEYRTKYNMVSLDDSQNIVVDRMKQLNTSATAARVRRSELDVRLKQAELALNDHRNPAELAALTGATALGDVQQKIDDLIARRTVLAGRYGRRHPAMQEIERQLTALEKLRTDQVKSAMDNLRSMEGKALAEEQDLADQLAKAEVDALKLDQIGVEYNVLRRAIDTQKVIYSQMLSRLNEAQISAQLESVNFRLADQAVPLRRPISPDLSKTAKILMLLAGAILIGYPFCAELLFAKVRSGLDIEHYLAMPLLGEISSARSIAEKDRPHIVRLETDEPIAEQFRSMFSQYQLVSKVEPPKAIVVTSTVPGEGKSFVASNLAAEFAGHGKRTLLIDADLRRPSQHRSYGLDNKAGVLRWLEEGGQIDDQLETDPRLGIVEIAPKQFLLRTGGTSRRASEIVGGGRVDALFEALQKRFDILIFDTPPVWVFPDAVAFTSFCDEIIFVCRFGVAARQKVRSVLDKLRQTNLYMPGVVLNALPSGRGTGYYYYKSYGSSKEYSKYYSERKSG